MNETAYAFISGIVAAVVIDIPTGFLMGKIRLVDELLLPWIKVFLSPPLTALVPMQMVPFGFGIIILNARAGALQINRSMTDMARSFGAYPWDALMKACFRDALPEILGGVIRAAKG